MELNFAEIVDSRRGRPALLNSDVVGMVKTSEVVYTTKSGIAARLRKAGVELTPARAGDVALWYKGEIRKAKAASFREVVPGLFIA